MVLTAASLLAAVIPLGGVSGESLSVQAELDGCNVRLGDPMSVSVSFYAPVGYDFQALHPPALAPGVDETVWRLDKESARTQTRYVIPQNEKTACGRTFIYGIRPLQEGLIEFPALEFSYENSSQGVPVTITTRPIPVHVRPAMQVALVETEDPKSERPMPEGLLVDLSASPWGSGGMLTDDELFAWRKACANPSAEAFAAFDIPEARLNEAACEILSDNWARALKIYASLEWQIGQIPAVERGIVAALAVKLQNPEVELPVWRQILRPLLRFALWGRIVCLLSLALLAGGLVWGGRRLILRLACWTVLFLPVPCLGAGGIDIFDLLGQGLDQTHVGMSRLGNPEKMPDPGINAKGFVASKEQRAGEVFELIVEVSMDTSCSLQSLEVEQSGEGPFAVVGPAQPLSTGNATSGKRRMARYSVPVCCKKPFDGRVVFNVAGQVVQKAESKTAHGFSSYSTSRPFAVAAQPIALKVSGPAPSAVASDPFDSFVARARVASTDQLVGRPFEIIYELETPKRCAIEGLTVRLPEGCAFAARGIELPDAPDRQGTNTDRVVRRFAFPLEFQTAFAGDLRFEVVGQGASERHRYARGSGAGYVTYPKPFSIETEPLSLTVREPEIKASVSVLSTNVVVSQVFELEVKLEVPANLTVEEGPRLSTADGPGLKYGSPSRTTCQPAEDDPQRMVYRLVVPARYDIPFKSPLTYTVSGLLVGSVRYPSAMNRDWPRQFFRRFKVSTAPVMIDVGVPEQARPSNFSGAVGAEFRLSQFADRTEVCTNDVVTLSCRLDYRGFLPSDLDLGGRVRADDRGRTWVEFKRYFVADGSPSTEELSLSYYDAALQKYVTVRAPGVALTYVPEDARVDDRVVVNAEGAVAKEVVPLLFAPNEGAAELGKINPAAEGLVITETNGPWVRVDDGRRAGWVKKEDLP